VRAPPGSTSRGDLIQLARVDFGAFLVLAFPELHDGRQMIPAPYVHLIVEALMGVRHGDLNRLIVNLPAGHMKSLIISVLYTAWLLGVDPSKRILCISYGEDLARQLSRLTRRVMNSALYRLIFTGTVLAKQSEDLLTTTRGGQRLATAVGGTIAAFRAEVTVVDDPMQPDEIASELKKQGLRDWYSGVVEQRLVPGGAIIVVMHRLSPDDFAATLLEKGGWFHISLPLIAVQEMDYFDRREASGEMSDAEFAAFNDGWFDCALPWLCDGATVGTFIDWRGYPIVHAAAVKAGLAPLNLIVWAKTNAGMGSLYRSQHELLPLFKKGAAPHVNNIELGKRGRWRSNLWTYPGASSLGSDARRGLQDHPTVKPVAMLEDALLDLTHRDDLVLDPFLGSGSTLIACEKTGRICRGLELDPLYADVIIRRFEAMTGVLAVLEETGERFVDLAARRLNELAASQGDAAAAADPGVRAGANFVAPDPAVGGDA
jgi:DNA modification methylase